MIRGRVWGAFAALTRHLTNMNVAPAFRLDLQCRRPQGSSSLDDLHSTAGVAKSRIVGDPKSLSKASFAAEVEDIKRCEAILSIKTPRDRLIPGHLSLVIKNPC